jgi:multicomponent Na+:H+ antiporter subunit G
MRQLLASAAVLSGAAFMFVAALGVARLPDIYTRMQAATKAATVGVAGVMCAVAVAHDHAGATIRAVLIAGFFLLTSPVAAHAIARAAHARGVPLAPGTWIEPGARRRAGAAVRAHDRASGGGGRDGAGPREPGVARLAQPERPGPEGG